MSLYRTPVDRLSFCGSSPRFWLVDMTASKQGTRAWENQELVHYHV